MEKGFVELILRDGTRITIEVKDIETYDDLKGYVMVSMKDNDFGPYELHSSITKITFDSWVQTSAFTVNHTTIDSVPSINIDSLPPLNIAQALSSSTPPMTQVNIGTTSQTLLAANANRKQIELFNQHSSQPIFFFLGSPATLTNGRMLDPGEKYEFPRGLVYTGIITAISSGSGTKPISVTEWT